MVAMEGFDNQRKENRGGGMNIPNPSMELMGPSGRDFLTLVKEDEALQSSMYKFRICMMFSLGKFWHLCFL